MNDSYISNQDNFFNLPIPTAQEKIKKIEEKEQKEKDRQYIPAENNLMEELILWFESEKLKTENFDCSLYSVTFLTKLKCFVEKNGYKYNSFIVRKRDSTGDHQQIVEFNISTN